MAESESGSGLDEIWQELLEAMPIGLVLLDRARRVRFVNRVRHGWSRSEVIDKPIDPLIPEADRARITRLIDEVWQTGTPRSYETRLVAPNGALVAFFVRLEPLIIDNAIRYVMLATFEITDEDERRKLRDREHALLAALEPLHRILLSAPVAEPMFDRLLREMLLLFDCDRAFLCYPADADAVTIVYEETTPEFRRPKRLTLPMDPVIKERIEQALEKQGQVVRRDPESDPIPVERPAKQDFGVRSMLYAAVHTGVDKPWLLGIHHCREARVYDGELALLSAIAARVGDALRTWKTQEAMRQSEERFRLLVENAPEAIVILDVQTLKFVELNSKASELFGMTREQLLQVGPVELSPELQANGEASAALAPGNIAAALRGESPVFEWLHRHASGALLECEVRLLHLPHPERQWIRGSMLNIAERKRVQRENERLSQQLAQAQKMQAIGHLTGGVAHDFNNLLTVIGGSLELMQLETNADANLRACGLAALDACHRAAALTQRLLAFSRQQPLRPRAIDVGELLHGMEALLSRTLGETVRIALKCSAELWLCEVDPVQLESSILNLCINARDAMSNGGQVTLEARNVVLEAGLADADLMAGYYVEIAVGDDGNGIPPELLGKVFEPFFTTKEFGKGSGLGLSMVYGFAKQSRGHVRIQSELGQGTTVRLLLPRSRELAKAEIAHAAGQSAPRGEQELILVVEDDTNLRVLAVELLQRLGYRTLDAGDAASALVLLAGGQEIALLLADIVLPGGQNGAELAREAQRRHPGLPVLFMSGYTENAVIHDGRLDEGVTLLEKPFTTAQLAAAVRKVLAESRAKER